MAPEVIGATSLKVEGVPILLGFSHHHKVLLTS
jgi:hypothetical protein